MSIFTTLSPCSPPHIATGWQGSTAPGTRPDAASGPCSLDLQSFVGAAAWARLPPAVQRRFATAHADASYEGHMTLRCSLIGRLYAACSHVLGGPLPNRNASDIGTTVRVRDNGRGGVVWERDFHAGQDGWRHVVRSTKEADARGGLMERTDGGLSMSLDVFEENGELVFRSRRYWLLLGPWRLGIPAWLAPGTCRVVHTDLGAGRFRFTMSMVHALWGETFYQTGVFSDPAGCHDEGAAS